MKKAILIFLAMSLTFVGAASAAVSSANGKLSITNSPNSLIIGLSPKVEMYYESSGATTVASQWFAISAGHPGGNICYGTSQDVNNIYQKAYTTTDELSTYLQSIPTVAGSEGAWTSKQWVRP